MIIDFAKYKANREIDSYFSENSLNNLQFVCPDCGTEEFHIFVDMTAVCSGCDLEILFAVGEDEL